MVELGVGTPTRPANNIVSRYGKGSKIKLIICAEFSVKGGGYPPSVKIIIFFQMLRKCSDLCHNGRFQKWHVMK